MNPISKTAEWRPRWRRWAPGLALLACAALGCGNSASVSDFIGDPGKPLELMLVFTDGVSERLVPIGDGTQVALVEPPQGGQVSYVGARLRNISRRNVQLAAHYLDPDDSTEVGADSRPTDLIVASDGWGEPDPRDPANFSNVAPCPDYRAKDVQGQTYQLSLTARDRAGHVGSVSAHVVPTCMQADPAARAKCVCLCSANYTAGKCP